MMEIECPSRSGHIPVGLSAPLGRSGSWTVAKSTIASLAFTAAGLVCLGGAAWAADEAAAEPAERPRFSLMSAEKEARLRQCLPKVADPLIQKVLDDPQLIFYTDAEMPKAYQFLGGSNHGVHAVEYNISANGSEPFGNGNREFPWNAPGGTHRTSGVRTFRFLSLPKDNEGKPLPVVWFRHRPTGDSAQGYAWKFPVGTLLGEVLLMRAPDGHDYTFELRIRMRHSGEWGVDVFRPFPEAADLVARVKELRPNWSEQPAVAALIEHLEAPAELFQQTLADRHPRRTFEQTAGIDSLPDVKDDELIKDLLLGTEFKSAAGLNWRRGTNGITAAAPTTAASFHIVPAKYDAGFIEVDSVSCFRCHSTVNQHVDRFQSGRDWYGRIRGSDGIFSFHPFSPSSISYNGYPNTVRMREEMIAGGVLEKFDPSRHHNAIYNDVPELVE